MVPTGRLRAAYGVDDIWDVVASSGEVISKAFPSDQMLSSSPGSNSAGSFRSLTVLCLRQNCLDSLKILPPSLLRLDVSDNALQDLTGIGQCRMLTLLNARKNRLRSMLGLERNLALSHLFLGYNDIAFVEGIAHLLLLETLDLAHNRLTTQASIRPLSLTRGLRHLMLRGNPVTERIKRSYRPLLRNLCPSLLSIDGDRLTFSRLAAKAEHEGSRLRLPYALGGSISGVDLSTTSVDDGDAAEVSQCASYMHLLTRGAAVGAGSGYVDVERAARTAKVLEAQAAARDKKRKQQRGPANRAGGEPLPQELLKHLAQESRKYLESLLEERLSSMQVSQVVDTAPAVVKRGDDNHALESLPNDTSAQCGGAGREDSETCVSGGNNRQAQGGNQNIIPVSISSEERDEGNQAFPVGNQARAVHRDATLDHEEWLRLREHRNTRCAPFGDTPQRNLPRPNTPDTPETRCVEDVVFVSPIRKDEETCHAASMNATEILRDVDMLDPRFSADGKVVTEPKARPRLVASHLRRPMLLSPSTDSPPVKAHRIYSGSKSRGGAKPFTAASVPRSHGTKAVNAPILLSPPPPLTSPCALHSNVRDSFVKKWVIQLCQDAEAIQDALQTLVSLLDSQGWGNSAVVDRCSFIPAELLAERKRCVEILTESGMLLDIEIPLDVVQQYHLTPDELRHTSDEECSEEDESAVDSPFKGCNKRREKREILRCIRLIGDGKTCLRYLVLLIEEGREEELQRYVNELRVLIPCE
ncbi:hypothetical protein TRSC58_01037 [Trypanosoma rangeli SC58]|uniref:Leucine-rich repeat protein (LRRP) n=1 Tax=Trypanosoma rangeli SC58 TaxID=429131 RepID=A0A061J6Z9_TRYRA|nr:hypothetical protein TRSC58_01037 [Trypanosoma rangeli SC58]